MGKDVKKVWERNWGKSVGKDVKKVWERNWGKSVGKDVRKEEQKCWNGNDGRVEKNDLFFLIFQLSKHLPCWRSVVGTVHINAKMLQFLFLIFILLEIDLGSKFRDIYVCVYFNRLISAPWFYTSRCSYSVQTYVYVYVITNIVYTQCWPSKYD